MEEKSKSNGWLIIILLVLVLALGGFIVYDKVLNKKGEVSSTTSSVETIDNINIRNLLALLIIKRDSSEKIQNYKLSNLTDKDVNDIICSYIVQSVDTVNGEGKAFQMKAEDVEKALKMVYGLDSSKINLAAGMDNYAIHTLSTIDIDGVKYYWVERKNEVPLDVPNDDLYDFGSSYHLSYKDGELIIESGVILWNSETPYYELLGYATIKFNITGGIKFVSFDYEKYESTETYSAAPIME